MSGKIRMWVARDTDIGEWSEPYPFYSLHLQEPTLIDKVADDGSLIHRCWDGDGFLDSFCPRMFEKLSGLELKPGECRRVVWVKPLHEQGAKPLTESDLAQMPCPFAPEPDFTTKDATNDQQGEGGEG